MKSITLFTKTQLAHWTSGGSFIRTQSSTRDSSGPHPVIVPLLGAPVLKEEMQSHAAGSKERSCERTATGDRGVGANAARATSIQEVGYFLGRTDRIYTIRIRPRVELSLDPHSSVQHVDIGVARLLGARGSRVPRRSSSGGSWCVGARQCLGRNRHKTNKGCKYCVCKQRQTLCSADWKIGEKTSKPPRLHRVTLKLGFRSGDHRTCQHGVNAALDVNGRR